MKAADELDLVLKGEAVEASQPVRELAELAALLQGAWQDGPAPDATDRVRNAAMAAFAAPTAAPTRARPGRPRRVVARLALVAALVVGAPVAAWGASADALPGEILYPVKRGFEEVRLVLAGDAASEAEVLLGMAEERLSEAVLALSLGLDAVVEQALAGYDDALLRFDARIAQAQAEGLPVESLLEEAQGLAVVHEELFETSDEPASVVPEAPVAPEEPAGNTGGDENGNKVGAKGSNQGGGTHGGGGKSKGDGGNGGGGGSGGGGSDDSSGGTSGGGTTTGGGGNSGGGDGSGGQGDGKEEDPPEPPDDEGDGDEDDENEGSGSGEGLGHEKAKGKGHSKHGDEG